uniref:Ribosomal protein S7 n=1 Tax=Halimeda minima TaxID=170427 RepID=A0A386AYZ7_9CHLO|nr:ribosomal protein S7 [Halimeda minima]
MARTKAASSRLAGGVPKGYAKRAERREKSTNKSTLKQSLLIQMIHQRLMRNGKKQLAFRIFQKSLNHIKNQTKQDPFLIIENGIRNTTPSVEIRTRRIGGAVYTVPIELSLDRGIPRAIRWILIAAKKRSGNKLDINLANEFIDASNKRGSAFYKKEEIQKLSEK